MTTRRFGPFIWRDRDAVFLVIIMASFGMMVYHAVTDPKPKPCNSSRCDGDAIGQLVDRECMCLTKPVR